MNILPLKEYCKVEGITADAVRHRLHDGRWRLGREVLRIRGFKNLYVDIEAVERFFRDPKNQDNH